MAPITRSEIETLMAHREPWCVSLYMSTHPGGSDVRQDPIRLKNLIRDAEKELVDVGVRTSVARDMLAPVQAMLNDSDLWRNANWGLAVFTTGDEPRVHRMPLPFEELAVVAPRFHLKPLLSLRHAEAWFYILSLSQAQIRMFRATRFDVEPVALKDTPLSLAEAMQYDDPERQLQWHSGTQPHQPGQNRPAVFHGQGTGTDEAEQKRRELAEYCRRIDNGVRRRLAEERAPLILATTEPMLGVYRQNNHYAHLFDNFIEGSPDQWEAPELHRRGVALLGDLFDQGRQEILARYERFAGGPRASCELPEVILAAADGQVATLGLATDEHRWGTFDEKTRQVEPHPQRQSGDYELVDLAGTLASQTGAVVHTMPAHQMPPGTVVAATYRFVSGD